mgnify:CR=1 FL=1
MTTLNLDNIPTVQHKIHFHNERLNNMLNQLKEYVNNSIPYNDFLKHMDKNKFSFMNERGNKICKILVTDKLTKQRWLFVY